MMKNLGSIKVYKGNKFFNLFWGYTSKNRLLIMDWKGGQAREYCYGLNKKVVERMV